MAKHKITIGIPAYNEEANITFLIEDIERQKQESIGIEKILIYSDGSTDETVTRIKEIKDPRVELISSNVRKGIALGLNIINDLSTSEILIVLNADIRIKDPYFLEKMAQPILEQGADLVSCPVYELPPTNLLGEVLGVSMDIKRKVFGQLRFGKNVFTCHGRARAFSKKLYRDIGFNFSVGEDAYSYLYCVDNHYRYAYVSNTTVFYKLPDNLIDHQSQSLRYYYSQKLLSEIFGEELIAAEYKFPSFLFLKSYFYYLIRKPLLVILYSLLWCFVRWRSLFVFSFKDKWDIALSSKRLNK
ncbi:MAG: glycosyltransferase [bacterium]|nr:glycosyltransferase [bacterium]